MGHAAKHLRRGLLGLVILLVVLVAVVQLISWNFLKPVISERFEAATGRSLEITGDVSLSLLPTPGITLRGVEVGNPDWAQSEHLFQVQRLHVEPSIMELLRGNILLEEVQLQEPVLNLEARADGPGNWVLDTGDDRPEDRQSQGLPASFEHLGIDQGKVRYRGPGAQSPEQLSVRDLTLDNGATGLDGEANLTLRERNFALQLDADSLETLVDEQRPFAGEVSLTSRESGLTTSFTLPRAPSLNGLQGRARLEMHDLAEWSRWLGLPPVALEQVELSGEVARDGAQWRLTDLEAAVDESLLTGSLTVDTGGDTLALNGELHSPRLNIAALQAALPQSEDESTGLALPVLPDMDGKLDLSVEQLRLQPATLENLTTRVQLGEHRVALEKLSFEVAGGSVEASASLTSGPQRVRAGGQVILQHLDLAALELALDPGDRLNGRIAFELGPMEQRPRFTPEALLRHLRIEQVRLAYTNEGTGTDLTARASTLGDAPVPSLTLDGSLRGKPLEASVTGDPLQELTAPGESYRFTVRASSDQLEARVETTLESILSPRILAGEMMVSADGAKGLETWLDTSLPPLPPFRLAGRFSRDGSRWSATDLSGHIAGESVGGSLRFNNTDQPRIEADLDLGYVDLGWFVREESSPETIAEAPVPASAEEAARDDSLLAPLRGLNAELDLHADTLVLPNEMELKAVDLVADMSGGQGQVQTLRFEVAGGSVDASLALDAREQKATGRLDAAFEQIHLGQLGDTFTPLEERLGRLSGELHLDITERRVTDRDKDLLLPFIGRVLVEPSRLRFEDAEADTNLTLTLATRGLDRGEGRFEVEGEGRYDGAPVSLDYQGDPLLNLREPGAPYGLKLDAEIVDTTISASGILTQPLKPEGLKFELAIAGPNPQRLSRLLGVSLPQLPPYSVSGDLNLKEDRFRFTQLAGTVGDSDIRGHLTLNIAASPPRLSGELQSKYLDIADLGFVIGADDAGDDAGDERVPEGPAGDRRILPDEPLIGDAWRTLSADVVYRAESVQAGDVPLSNVVIDLLLDDGRWQFEPLSFGIGQGSVDLILELDATQEPPAGTMQVEVRGLDLQEALANLPLADESIGILGARGKLWVEGRSVAELLASADGGLVLLMTGGRLEAVLVELAGLDAGQAFTSWLRGREAIPIDCAYADLQARDGVTELDTFLVDTTDTVFTAGGEIDLNNERLDVTLMAHPKDASVLVARSPLHLGGTFANIEVGVHGGTLTVRTLASGLLAAASGPLTALLPLLDLGTVDEPGICQGLIRQTRQALDEGARE